MTTAHQPAPRADATGRQLKRPPVPPVVFLEPVYVGGESYQEPADDPWQAYD